MPRMRAPRPIDRAKMRFRSANDRNHRALRKPPGGDRGGCGFCAMGHRRLMQRLPAAAILCLGLRVRDCTAPVEQSAWPGRWSGHRRGLRSRTVHARRGNVFVFVFDINPKLGHGRRQPRQDQALDHLPVGEYRFVPGITAPGQDGGLALERRASS